MSRIAPALRLGLLLGALWASQGAIALAEEGVLPADVVADLVRKVAPYERGYAKRAADGLVVAVVFSAASDASRHEKDLIVAALEKRMTGARIVAVDDGAIAGEKEVDLMVLCEGVLLKDVVGDAARRHVLAIALHTADVESVHGAPMGLVPRGGKPKIIVHLAALERAALDVDARLLGLAEAVDKNVAAED